MIARGVLGAGGATRTDCGVKRTGGAREGSARRAGTRTRAGGDDPDYNDWMEKARATANKRAAEFRKERGAQPGANQTARRYTRAGRDEDRARTAAIRGYEMDEEGNYIKPEPSVEELLRGTAWEMDPRQDATQFSMTKE